MVPFVFQGRLPFFFLGEKVLAVCHDAHRGGRSVELAMPQIALLRAYLGLLKYDLFEVCVIYKYIFIRAFCREATSFS